MLKNKIILACLFIALALCTTCKKELFNNVEVHGRVVNFASKGPVAANVVLWGGGRPGDNGSMSLASAQTSPVDGSFDIKTNAFRPGNYYLQIFPQHQDMVQMPVSLVNNQNKNIGDQLMGQYTFLCKVNLVPVSNSAIDIYNSDANSYMHYSVGTVGSVIVPQTISEESFRLGGPYFRLTFKTYPNGAAVDSTRLVPIALPPDTLYATIQY